MCTPDDTFENANTSQLDERVVHTSLDKASLHMLEEDEIVVAG